MENEILGWLVYCCIKQPIPKRKGFIYELPYKYFKTKEEADNFIKERNGK